MVWFAKRNSQYRHSYDWKRKSLRTLLCSISFLAVLLFFKYVPAGLLRLISRWGRFVRFVTIAMRTHATFLTHVVRVYTSSGLCHVLCGMFSAWTWRFSANYKHPWCLTLEIKSFKIAVACLTVHSLSYSQEVRSIYLDWLQQHAWKPRTNRLYDTNTFQLVSLCQILSYRRKILFHVDCDNII